MEGQKEEENPPISEFQPTPEEEVENAIHSDNATETAEIAALEDSQDGTREQSIIDSTINAARETVVGVASNVTETADSARAAVTGSGPRQDHGQRRTGQIGEPKPTIYIGNLFFDVTENDLVKELSRFGTILKCRLMRDSRGLSKG